MLFNKCSLLIPSFSFIAILYRYLSFYYLFVFKNLPPTSVTDYFFGGSKELLIPPPLLSLPLNLILPNFYPGTFIQIMASISRPLKTYLLYPIVAKRIGGGGTSAFSEGVPAAVGPRALSPRESRGEVHRQRRTRPGNDYRTTY